MFGKIIDSITLLPSAAQQNRPMPAAGRME
jgi:hypothetical protein